MGTSGSIHLSPSDTSFSCGSSCAAVALDQEKIEAACDEVFDDLVESIIELCKINSVESQSAENAPFGEGCLKALQKALSISERLGFRTDSFQNMVGSASIGPDTEEYIGLVGHVDVVAADGIWTTPPFEPAIRDGRIYARGVLDNKGPILSSMYAAYVLNRLGYDYPIQVKVLFGTNEETGMEDMPAYFQDHPYPQYGWTPDCKFPVVYAERGRVKLRISSANPGNEPLYTFLNSYILNASQVEKSLGIDYVSEEFGINQVRKMDLREGSDGAYLDLIISYPADMKLGDIVAQVKRCSGDGLTVEVAEQVEPVFFPTDSLLVKSLTKGYELVTGVYEKPVPTTGGTYAKVVQNIVPFGPSFKGQKDIAHLPDEWMNLEDIRMILKIYAVSLWQLCEAIKSNASNEGE